MLLIKGLSHGLRNLCSSFALFVSFTFIKSSLEVFDTWICCCWINVCLFTAYCYCFCSQLKVSVTDFEFCYIPSSGTYAFSVFCQEFSPVGQMVHGSEKDEAISLEDWTATFSYLLFLFFLCSSDYCYPPTPPPPPSPYRIGITII